MDIVFLWNSNLNNKTNNGIILSGKYDVSFNRIGKIITINKNKDFIRSFWGRNISDCFAVVGENGSGKTMLVNDIMYTIRDVKLLDRNQEDYFMIFEDEVSQKLHFVCTEKFKEWTIDICEEILYDYENDAKDFMKKFEIAYFHNALNINDYLAQGRCKCDFSIANQIYKHRCTTYEMHYDDLSKDSIVNFFENETFRIISFLYDYAIHNDLKIEFPVPEFIEIGFANDYYSERYILGEAKGLRVDRDEEEELAAEIQRFSDGVDNITDIYGRSWISCTIKNLIYNVFKELCIPATVPTKITYKHIDFFEACSFLNNANKLYDITIYQCAYGIIDNLRRKFADEKICIDAFEQYVQWIENNTVQIGKYEKQGLLQLCIHIEKSSEEFVTNLLRLYSKVNLAFPFYRFSFGLSTGEYYFLSIFSNLYSMCKQKYNNINVYDGATLSKNVKSLLLIFDEADLSLHPKWQRMFMKWLTDFCEQLFNGVSLKIVVTTHSPILLSDFPGNSVLYLKKYNNQIIYSKSEQKNTFGCNIHSLFLNSFFLESEGTMGALAEDKINEVARAISCVELESKELEVYEKIIDYIGEGIIKDRLKIALKEKKKISVTVVDETERKVIQETILQLKMQKTHLEQLISGLEETIHDKN